MAELSPSLFILFVTQGQNGHPRAPTWKHHPTKIALTFALSLSGLGKPSLGLRVIRPPALLKSVSTMVDVSTCHIPWVGLLVGAAPGPGNHIILGF